MFRDSNRRRAPRNSSRNVRRKPGVSNPAPIGLRFQRRLGHSFERAAEPPDRHFRHQAAPKIRFRHQLDVHEVAIRLDRNPLDDRFAEQLKRTGGVPEPHAVDPPIANRPSPRRPAVPAGARFERDAEQNANCPSIDATQTLETAWRRLGPATVHKIGLVDGIEQFFQVAGLIGVVARCVSDERVLRRAVSAVRRLAPKPFDAS